ncbi:MAG: efflux transporter outer membrane subunit [Caulobacteraceae bacterium]|nr:efflux transporter outer membrane subunit [Caulobacteraceae bacterium]
MKRPDPRRAAAARPTLALLASAALAGCAVGPNFTPPAAPTQQSYTVQPATALPSAGPGEPQQQIAEGADVQADWWTLLGSPELDRTVAMALANNQTIAAAQANLAGAADEVAIARGGLYPQIDATANLARNQYGASFLGPQAFTFPRFSAYSAGAAISYDPDAFGGVHRSIELASANAAAQGEALNAARLSIAGDTVIEALQIASIRAQIDVVREVIASDEKTLDLVKTARASGVASDMDVTTAQSQLDHDRTLLPPLRQDLNAAQDALPILVGQAPADWAAPDFALDRLSLPRDLPLSVPSALVRQRPDIRAAEARLHAASAAVGVATADLYPRFTLSGTIAEQGLLTGPAGAAWSLVGGLTAPVFHGGALKAGKRAAEDDYRAAYAQYRQTVLLSFQQVADSLHALSNSADAVQTQAQALASADAALRLTRLGYGAGNAGIIQVLDAQRLRQLAELGLVQARTQRYLATVRLYLALGGGAGWRTILVR